MRTNREKGGMVMLKDLEIQLEAPVSINSDRATENARTLDYISGSTIRGALAGRYLSQTSTGKADEIFEKIFVEDNVKFGNLYPFAGKPLPKTAVTCKRWSGFKDENKHGVFDNLPLLAIRWLVSLESSDYNELNEVNNILSENRSCSTCCENEQSYPLEPVNGFYKIENGRAVFTKPTHSLITRTGINRKTGNVEHGILYNIEVINEYIKDALNTSGYSKTFFKGQVKIEDSLPSEIKDQIHRMFASDPIIRLGTSKTRGLGKTKVQSYETSAIIPDLNNFRERLNQFNVFIRKKFRKLSPTLYEKYAKKKYFLSIDFLSDAILIDKYLRYKTAIDTEVLSGLLPEHTDSIHIIGGVSRHINIAGWNSALGMPKSDELAIEKGSVVLLSYDGSEESLPDALYKDLFSLEQKDIGVRNNEGYGRIKFSDEFHFNKSFEIKGRQ
jgi:CRISPR-associated protein Csx10